MIDVKKNPKLSLGLYGNTNQVVIAGIITNSEDSGNEEDESEYKPGGRKRVLMLAKVDGLAQNY